MAGDPSKAERLEELAAMVGAGAATAEDRAELDRLVADDPAAAAIVRDYADAGALLALELPREAPPAGALDAIQAAIQGETARTARGTSSPSPGGGADIISIADRRRTRAIATAVIALAAAAGFAFMWQQERSRTATLRGDLAAQQGRMARELIALERDLTAKLETERASYASDRARYGLVRAPRVSLATVRNDAGTTMKIFIDPSQRRWPVLAHQLPEIDASKDFQLWFLPADGSAPVSAGVLELGPDGLLGVSPRVPAGLDKLKVGLSVEVKGGAPQPTTVILVSDGLI